MSRNLNVKCRNATLAMLSVSLLFCSSIETLAQSPQLELRGPTVGLSAPPGTAPEVTSREFQATGILYRVKRNDSGSERYALMDDDGKILAFLAPSSRHDLQSFVGQTIGIRARTFGGVDDVAPYVMVDRVSLKSTAVVDSAVQPAGHDQELESVIVPIESYEPSWVPSSASQAGGFVAPAVGGDALATCSDGSCGEVVYDSGYDSGYDSVHGGVLDGVHGGVPGGYVGDGCLDPGCESCSSGGYLTTTSCTTCGIGMPCCCPQPCGPPGWLWLRGEYLLWFANGMDLPPLVTTSPAGTAAGDAGVLGEPGTEVLYGDNDVLTDGRSGFRILFGGYLGPLKKLGWEAEYFDVGDIDELYAASGDGNGNPILARPFFNMELGANDAELVSFPGILTGTVEVGSYSRFNGAAGRFRYTKCCKQKRYDPCDPCGGCRGCGYPPYGKIDFTAGYRYYGLDEGLTIREDLTSLQANNAGRFQLRDTFETRNDFHGGEIGTSYQAGWNRWTLDMLMRIAIGGTRQQVRISGETTISPLVAPTETFEGGLLAQRSNIGEYERNDFSMIPEFGTNLGFYLSPRMRVMVGYTLIYWSNVVRPGDQIDLDVNPNLIPPEVTPFSGPLRPEFVFRESDFWVHGLNVGLDYRW